MFWVTVKRISRSGFFNFLRNGFISLSAVLVMTVTLSVLGAVIFSGAVLNSTLETLKNKVDIRVTFTTEADEEEVLAIRRIVESLPEVEYVVYVSRDEALRRFEERHRDDQLILQALEELADNPLGAVLSIKAKDTAQYEGVANFLQDGEFLSAKGRPLIDRINFFQNKAAIDTLSNIIAAAKQFGLMVTAVLVFLSVVITFNTIRLVIYISREEIAVMKLVGAGLAYTRGPFVVSGILYGLSAALLTLILFMPLTYWLRDSAGKFFVGLDVFEYYLANFGQIFLIIIVAGVVIGAVSSYWATHRYLKN